MRYADDFLVLALRIDEPVLHFLTDLLEGKMGLKLNQSKTRIVDLREAGSSLDFLGYTFRFDADLKGRSKRYLNLFPSKKSLKRRRAEIKALTSRSSCFPMTHVVAAVNKSLLSWGRYFAVGYPAMSFRQMDHYVHMRFGRFLRNRSQRRMKPPNGVSLYEWLRRLGLIRLGDHKTIAYLQGIGPPPTYRRAG